MAVDAPLLMRQRVFAASAEATTGTAETLDATDATFNIFNPELVYDIPMNERQGQSSLSHLPAIQGTQAGTCTFETQVHGNGGSGSAAWTLFLTACGFSVSGGTYTIQTGSTSLVTLTMGDYMDGRLRRIAGACGNLEMTGTAGNPVQCNWTFNGKYVTPTDVALLAPTYTTVKPPRFASATMTVGGNSYKINEFTLNLNNEVVPRQDATDATGIHAYCITNRKPTITIDPEAALFATKDWHTDWAAHTEAAINIVIGSDSNNTITINAPKAQLTSVKPGDRGGIATDQLEFQLNRSASAGDDELTIAFT